MKTHNDNRYPIQSEDKPVFQLGTILRDIDSDDEYSVITEIYKTQSGTIMYVHRDLDDLARKLITSEVSTIRFYKEV